MTGGHSTIHLDPRFRLIGTWNTQISTLSCQLHSKTSILRMAVRWYASILSSGRDLAASNENVVDYLDLEREKLDDEKALKVVPKRLRRRLKRFRTIKHATNLKVMAYSRRQNLRRCKKLYRKQWTIRRLRVIC